MKEGLAFGGIISATDPVCIIAAFERAAADPGIFVLIFGESILNDAVSMVIYEQIYHLPNTKFNAAAFFIIIGRFILGIIASPIFGFLLGYLTALLLKGLTYVIKSKSRLMFFEISLLIYLPWLFYLVGSLCGMSAILIIFFNGLAQQIYTKPYLNPESRRVIVNYLGSSRLLLWNIF